ncbi:DUF1064 domain-containing protein [bacterium]|nr:DUF1064 domain-containing protein [bacterium]
MFYYRKKGEKYNNKKVIIDNIKFDSKKEANRYLELKFLLKYKKIKNLELQKVFLLQKSFKDNEGKTQRAIKYIADFQYIDVGSKKVIVEDVKGMKTEVYKIKKKLLLYKFPKIIFKET